MLARAKRKRGDSSSDTPTDSTFGKPSEKAREEDKQVPGKNLVGGVALCLTTHMPTINVDTYDISLPLDFLATEGVRNGIQLSAEKLLFPSAKERLNLMDVQSINAQTVQLGLQCAQNALASCSHLAQMAKEVAIQNDKVIRLQEQLLRANQAKEHAEKTLKGKEAEMAEKVDQLNTQVVSLQEELKDQEAEIIMRVQATMANKFLLGKIDKKNLQSMIDDYLQVGCIKDMESEEAKKDETADAMASTTNSGSAGPQGDVKGDQAGNPVQMLFSSQLEVGRNMGVNYPFLDYEVIL